jgi:hypothetical protein
MNNTLSVTFFSSSNQEYLQREIAKSVLDKTSYKIGRQNDGDLFNLMKKYFTELRREPDTDILNQVKDMNSAVVNSATSTISTGILQNIGYLRDISSNPVPPAQPKSTSAYGLRLTRN